MRPLFGAVALAFSAAAFPLVSRDDPASSVNATGAAGNGTGSALNCSALWDSLPKLLPNLTIETASDLAAGTNFTPSTFVSAEQAIAYPRYAPNLPAICRLGAYITTSNISKVYFEGALPRSHLRR